MTTFTGTAGNDIANATTGTLTGFTGGTVAQLQDLIGDIFIGLAGNDSVVAGGGDDSFRGLAGNDTFNGGAGFDEVRYDQDAANGGGGAVTVNLATGVATDGFGNTDTLISVEYVRGTNFADSIIGNASDNIFTGLGGNDTINGGAGQDEMRYDRDAAAGGAGAVTVNLATGVATDGFGATDTLSNIERVRGTNLADTLTGDANNNQFSGLGGNDTLNGGGGNDEARYDHDASAGGAGAVTVNLATGTATDGFGNTDTLISIKNARGTNLADSITGNGLDNFFRGLGGNDTLNGNGGNDWASYDRDVDNGGAGAVTVNLAAGTATDGFGAADTLISIENVRGGALGDFITGDGNDNFLQGLAGNDTLNGGAGFDDVSYERDSVDGGLAGVTVNLATGAATDGFGNTDTLVSIEGVTGTNLADSITGDANDNFLRGLGGNDTIIGAAGIDGVAYDQDANNGGFAGVTVNLATGTATDGFGNTDTLVGNENARGSNQADSLTGNPAGNGLEGLGGADTINGGGGIDEARYDHDAIYGGGAGVTVNLNAGTAIDGFGAVDTLIGIRDVLASNQADSITGDGANNSLRGLGGNDTLNGGAGFDMAAYDRDAVHGGGGGVNVNLATGLAIDGFGNTDTLTSIESVVGTAFNDTFTSLLGAPANFAGGLGNDTYVSANALDSIYEQTGEGTDTVQTSLAFYALDAGNTLDNLTFTNGAQSNNGVGNGLANVLTGGAGSDALTGNGGADTLNAGGGADYLYMDHLDTANAGAGYDAAFIQDATGINLDVGAAQLEYVYAYTGNDTLNASTSTVGVALIGEAGADVISGSNFNDYVYFDGLDFINAGAGNDALFYYQGTGQALANLNLNVAATNAEYVLAGGGNDALFNTGSATAVALIGGAGNDTLTGGLGNDYFYGDSGGGNLGNDVFVVTLGPQTDVVLDFSNGADRLNVHATGFTTFAQVQAAATASGASTILNFGGGNTMTLYNFALGNLDASDIIF